MTKQEEEEKKKKYTKNRARCQNMQLGVQPLN